MEGQHGVVARVSFPAETGSLAPPPSPIKATPLFSPSSESTGGRGSDDGGGKGQSN